MNRAAFRLAVSKAFKIYKGEGGRVIAFSILHILISVVIGMTGTLVDAVAVGNSDPRRTYVLYGLSAAALLAIGLFYAGVTDRTDKRRILTRILFISIVISSVGAAILASTGGASNDRVPLLVLGGLFVWRFLIGIVLLMVFWDLTPFYFNARQGKRLFPLLAIGGAVGYSLGSLSSAWLSGILPSWGILIVIAILTLCGVSWFQHTRSTFSILDSPRYRDRSIVAEIREGVSIFWQNPFLRVVGWNTILFGVLAGLIVFTYNAVVTARTAGTEEAAELIGLQRAVVSILQATIFTKVMSQSAVGGKGRSSLIQQSAFLILGTVAFAISMVGVADFTRQIEVALMSPAAIAAFAFLPARYRGRVMVLNNLAAVAIGIIVSTIAVAMIAPLVEPLWFAYPIAALMLARIILGIVLNRRYTALLSHNIVSEKKLNLSKIEENAGSILRNEELFSRIVHEIGQQSESVRVFVLGRLARAVETPEDVDRVAPLFSDASPELQGRWIETISRVSFDRYRNRIEAAFDSESEETRKAARLETLRQLWKIGSIDDFRQRIASIVDEFKIAVKQRSERYTELLGVIIRVENATGEAVIEVDWELLNEEQRYGLLDVLADFPSPRYYTLLKTLLDDTKYGSAAITAVASLPSDFLMERRSDWKIVPLDVRIELLRALNDEILRREEGMDLLIEYLSDRDDPLEMVIEQGDVIVEIAMVVLSDPAPLPIAAQKAVRLAISRASETFPHLFRLRFAVEEIDSSQRSLARKLASEYVGNAASIVLILSSLLFQKEDDRRFAYSVCQELTERSAVVQNNALEFIESKFTGELRTYLLTTFESMTPEEKKQRLSPLLRRTSSLIEETIYQLKSLLRKSKQDVAYQIIGGIGTT